MTRILLAGVVLATLALASCKKDPATEVTAAMPESAPESFRDNPDFGGVQGVSVEVEGVGPTPNIAALRALDQAIAQVNGRRVSSSTAAMASGVNINVAGLGSTSINSDAYADLVVSSSDGVVRSFAIVSSEEVERVDAERSFSAQAQLGGWLSGDSLQVKETERHLTRYWKVLVKAEVAKFVGPKDDGRPSITIAAPRTNSESYAVGDGRVDAAGVVAEIRSRLSDALTQTERFQVLDREFNDEMQAEVEFINSGNARSEEVARLGQRLATDLILVPTIERFAYPRSSRQLRMSNRELVSYSGGGRISLRLINATTGEVVMSETFNHDLSPTAPSTLARSVDGVGLAGQLMDSLSGQMTKAVINEIFPISVIAITGNQVVLSQGGKSVATGERYEAVVLGEELKDPQTGRSLGRMELPCCIVHIDRVADKTSYGSIEGTVPTQLSTFEPGMVELRGLAKQAGISEKSVVAPAAIAQPVHSPARSATNPPQRAAAANADSDDW